jgi:hypothetical protein
MGSEIRPTATEKECPNCHSDAVAWIATSRAPSSDSGPGRRLSDEYECRRCKSVFVYEGPE